MEADYIVIRAAADLPAGFLPPEMEGKWFDRAELRAEKWDGPAEAVAVPATRFETREDGKVAEVYEVRP